MVKATVHCSACNEDLLELEAPTYRELCMKMQVAVIACHAASPHLRHLIKVRFEGKEDRGGELLTIECLHGCGFKEKMVTRVPIELAGLVAITFHTAHEGHRMRVQYGDEVWESPEPKAKKTRTRPLNRRPKPR